ncbi:aspartyl-phosphate phosphatase Spo0E family protein [Alkalicoccus halolimnae]|uniref:Aspartyl-phosphate phosphatase Spo0E family protein n=1 Tax=Alkalicoccus halolimnae TaxID=1667239 RepID=A0A5C7F7C1_9BACI|nr:aspartyl-phosphate phosphatase Spo0E family protein [Alkalicoccus halolimnae]TXF86601.1 aspartyl-phosphate phosphatase Spo0E family protein [Alkalicoccus halolimnae]
MSWNNELIKQMEHKRNLMVITANKYGYTSAETIQYSQELDRLMNIYRCVSKYDYSERLWEKQALKN